MKKICLIAAVCLMLGCLSACSMDFGKKPEQTVPTTAATEQTQPTTLPPETQPEPTTEPTTEPTEPPAPRIIGYDLELPEGFEVKVSEDDRTIYTSTVSGDDSAILIRTQPLDESVLELDEQGFEQLQPLEQEYESLSLFPARIDSQEAVFVDYVVLRQEQRIHIYEYIVVGSDENYVFQFSDYTEEEDWLEAFADAVKTINLLMENEGVELDYNHLEYYKLPCGIGLYAGEGMEPQNAPGFSGCIGSREAIILVMKDNKEENNLTELTLAEYGELVSGVNELDGFTQDNYGNLHVTFYSSDSMGKRYYNYLTVKETSDSYWVIQMTCASDEQAAFNREFALWATSIEEN